MTNATRPPDIDGMIGGGQARRRRRNAARAGIAAVAVLALGGGAYGVTQLGDGDAETAPPAANQPSAEPQEALEPPRYQDLDGTKLEPGTYRKYVGSDGSGGAIEVDLTFGPGWDSSGDPMIWRNDTNWAGLAIMQVAALPGESGCLAHRNGGWAETWNLPGRPAAESADKLAQQLAELPGGTVLERPQPTEAFGYTARHLSVRVQDECEGTDIYLLAETTDGDGHGLSYYDNLDRADRVVVLDFLVLDTEWQPVVVALFHHADATQRTVDQVAAVRDSMTFVTRD